MPDAAARQAALDPQRSWQVQAPAGSGKTELLIQRYLSLLARVDQPEQVVAITFTRKAAAEMRQRVIAALEAAASHGEQQTADVSVTATLARAALARDAAFGWRVREQPERLRIDTLDALNAYLAQRLPLLSGGVANARLVEDARRYYYDAADRAVAGLLEDPNDECIRVLAREQGGDLTGLARLLAELLPRRDQWLRHLAGGDDMALRNELERALARLVADTLEDLEQSFDAPDLELADALISHTVSGDVAPTQSEPGGTARSSQPVANRDLTWWRRVAALLLTVAGAWRRRPPTRRRLDRQHPEARSTWQRLLSSSRVKPRRAVLLGRVQRLPEPRCEARSMRVLAALRRVLVRAVAELELLFAELKLVDFVELALRAQQALGSSEQPSELLLALDRRIEHLLVDEFQDTSHQQMRLLELLTSGWQPGDGRTLFLVGDPMQSIYRFRDADVSLFLTVADRGLGTVVLESLRLTKNFRSAPGLVGWTNSVFSHVFPETADLDAGAASFVASEAEGTAKHEQCVRVHALRNDEESSEVERVAAIVAEEIAGSPEQSLAILVQSRTHLAGLRERLRKRGIDARTIEIESLGSQQLGQDLIALAKALIHLADRLAWLGVLRAPWCGLRWRDVDALCTGAATETIWQLMHDPSRLERLSDDGRARLEATRSTLEGAFAERGASRFVSWVRRTWEALGGAACIESAEERELADRFFWGLAELAVREDVEDPARIGSELSRLAALGSVPHGSGVEIMTIHRAKGLEFDTVVLFGLAREPLVDPERALYWLERVSRSGERDLLLAPLGAKEEGRADPLTEYLKGLERERERAERARLLYVAVTRARSRLHLVARVASTATAPPPRSLLAPLWPALESAFPEPRAERVDATRRSMRVGSAAPLRRRCHVVSVPAVPGSRRTRERPPFLWAGHTAVAVGTVVHGELQRLATPASLATSAVAEPQSRFERHRRALALLGVEPAELAHAAARVDNALHTALDDPRGKWILENHAEARSELALTVRTPRGLEGLVLDRTFVAEGIRWIIDFKTSVHEGGSLDAFLATEVERYRDQLERYAEAMRSLDQRPIRLGLYFPLLPTFCSWQAGAASRDFQIG